MINAGGEELNIRLESAENTELEVIVKGDIQSEEALEIVRALQSAKFGKLMLQSEDESVLVNADEIQYFEVINGKTYAVTAGGVYTVRETLCALCETLKSKGFIQINKSTVVNINSVQSISAEFSGNYTARLKNRKETLIISRKYFNAFKEFVRR